MKPAAKPEARTSTRGYAHLIEVSVPVARIWRALLDPSLILIWRHAPAQIDARRGGLYRVGKTPADLREAHIDVFETNRRLRLIYLPSRQFPPSDTAIVDDFLLDVKGEKSTLRLLGSGISEAKEWDKHYVRLRMTWERLLGRLRNTLEHPPVPKAPAPPKDPPLPFLDD